MATSVIKLPKDKRFRSESNGYISARNIEDGVTSFIDVFDSNGNGIILGVSSGGISAYRQVNGVQTTLFSLH